MLNIKEKEWVEDMKTIAVIPARYKSTRFEGKPIADICGKPMIWWVYNQVKKVKEFDDVYVATDNEIISNVCEEYKLKYLMTSDKHRTSTERLYEVARHVEADYYVCINGDEPLIEPHIIKAIIPEKKTDNDIYISNLMTEIRNPVEVVDSTNIKVVTDKHGYALYMSRSPIPYPKASMDYSYKKHLGVLCYNFEALKFFNDNKKNENEKVEDINELRFIENGQKIKMIEVNANSLSVDTPKDLQKVIDIIKNQREVAK